MIEKSFGEKIDGIAYKDRVGAYAIIFDQDNRLPIVKTSTGYFLLGGGIDGNESHQNCLERECLEEAGLYVRVKDLICKGDKYHWSDTLEYYMHGIGYFYSAEIVGKSDKPTEEDHTLVWMTIEECLENLFLEHQAWAVEYAQSIRVIEIL